MSRRASYAKIPSGPACSMPVRNSGCMCPLIGAHTGKVFSSISPLPRSPIYGWHTVKAKHMVPSNGVPAIFNAVFITEVWAAPIMLILTLYLRVRVLYYEAMVMYFILLFRHTITAVRYGYMHKRLRRTIYHSRDRLEVERIHNDTQLITAWLAVAPSRIPVLVRAAARARARGSFMRRCMAAAICSPALISAHTSE